MRIRDEKLQNIINWAEINSNIRVVLLTSSLVNPLAPVDDLSDLDIELVFENNEKYVENNLWLNNFGTPIAMIEEDETSFDGKHAMKMLLYEDGVKVDFKLYSKSNFVEEIQEKELPYDWDIGYKVLVDKEGLTRDLKKPSYQASIIKKPTESQFQALLKDFWWDTTYVSKSLKREDLFYAKYMSEQIRENYLTSLIEFYIASQHDWNVTTNKHGRLFKQYLSPEMWTKIEATFSGSDIQENWKALFIMMDLVNEMGIFIAEKLNISYPQKLENDIRKYTRDLKSS